MKKAAKTHDPIRNRAANALAAVALASLATLSAGCGQQAFQATASQEDQQAPGTFTIAPKVDVLLVQDDTGSSGEIFSQLSSDVSGFLSQLDQRGWDHHFAIVPLTHFRAIQQVQAARFDSNWGSQWLAPFPGATLAMLTGQVSGSAFRFPDHYDAFLRPDEVYITSNEPAFANINSQLRHSSMTSTGFLRSDAMLAVITLSTGDDNTELNTCVRSDGYQGPCNDPTIGAPVCTTPGQTGCNNEQQTFNKYKSLIQGVRPNPAQLKFYAAIANQKHSQGGCRGANTFSGYRYKNMASALGGASFDLCTQPLGQILDSVGANLQSLRFSLRTRYLFIAQEPKNDDSLKVWRNPGGNAAARVAIPRDRSHVNGWDFVGNVSNVYTIDSPVNLNLASGWAIELYGPARITGNDTAKVEYEPIFAQDTVSK